MELLTASLKDEVGDLLKQRCAALDMPFNIYIANLIVEDARRNQDGLSWQARRYLSTQDRVDSKKSAAYEMMFAVGFEKGRLEVAREMLLNVGQRHLGLPTPEVKDQISSASIMELEAWAECLFDVESWDDLFAEK